MSDRQLIIAAVLTLGARRASTTSGGVRVTGPGDRAEHSRGWAPPQRPGRGLIRGTRQDLRPRGADRSQAGVPRQDARLLAPQTGAKRRP